LAETMPAVAVFSKPKGRRHCTCPVFAFASVRTAQSTPVTTWAMRL
jgi:hypothetical protein